MEHTMRKKGYENSKDGLELHKFRSQLQMVTSAPPKVSELQRFKAWPSPQRILITEKIDHFLDEF